MSDHGSAKLQVQDLQESSLSFPPTLTETNLPFPDINQAELNSVMLKFYKGAKNMETAMDHDTVTNPMSMLFSSMKELLAKALEYSFSMGEDIVTMEMLYVAVIHPDDLDSMRTQFEA